MIHENIVQSRVEKMLGQRDELTVYDSWTPRLEINLDAKYRYAAIDRERLTKLFTRTRARLRKTDTLWLTQETHWLDKGKQYTLEMPQTHVDRCGYYLKGTRAHEEAARRNPGEHARFDGSITVSKSDPRTLVATVRLTGEQKAATTVQLRHEPVKKRGQASITVQLLAYLGTRDKIDLAASSLAAFLNRREFVEQAMRRIGKAADAYHRSFDHALREKRVKGKVDNLNMAGSPGSPERLYWSVGEGIDLAPLRFKRGWAQSQLPALKAD